MVLFRRKSWTRRPLRVRARLAAVADAPAMARILNRWIDATPWMPRVHAREDVVAHLRDVVLPREIGWVAHENGRVRGFATLDAADRLVTGLYVDRRARGNGIGMALLDRAKAHCPNGLGLWTFVANTDARRFYEREGFREVARTDGDNEEGLPDILFRWTPEEAR